MVAPQCRRVHTWTDTNIRLRVLGLMTRCKANLASMPIDCTSPGFRWAVSALGLHRAAIRNVRRGRPMSGG